MYQRKLNQPSIIEGPNPKKNIDNGGETTQMAKEPEIDDDVKLTKLDVHSTKGVNKGNTLIQNDDTDKMMIVTK